jgi:hypothetical protein
MSFIIRAKSGSVLGVHMDSHRPYLTDNALSAFRSHSKSEARRMMFSMADKLDALDSLEDLEIVEERNP